MPKPKVVDLLYELMRNSRRSDRELSRVIGVSQPTVTRNRAELEQAGYIREYTIIPALEKLDFEILALNFVSIDTTQEGTKTLLNWISENSQIIFSSAGQGIGGKTLLLASVHRTFTDFSNFSRELRGCVGTKATSIESFLVSLRSDIVKNFSFKSLQKT